MIHNKLPEDTQNKFSNLIFEIEGLNNSPTKIDQQLFSFKGRKSKTIAQKVINYLTNDSSIVCDPFFGSGTFALSSSSLNRKTIGIELDNYTFSVVKTLSESVNINILDSYFNEIKSKVFENVMSLYETHCCGHKNYIKRLYFDPCNNEYFNPISHREIKDNCNIILYDKCPICNKIRKKFKAEDMDKINYCNTLDTSRFPKHKYIENSRINITESSGANFYNRNFTSRSQYSLISIQDAINLLPNSHEKDILEHVLVSSLTLSRITQYGSSSEYIYHVVKEKAQETNVWYVFEYKYELIKKYLNTRKNSNNLTLYNGDYKSILSQSHFKNKIDLIYTDPPYTDQVPYLERSQLYRDWLRVFYNKNFVLTQNMLDSEIVVSNAPQRAHIKTLDNYYNDIDKMFEVFSSATTKNGIIALTLNLGKKKYFETLSTFIDKARKNGFEYVLRIDLCKNDPSLRKQSAFKNTLSTEMLVIFTKLCEDKQYWYYNNHNIELEIIRTIYKEIIANEGITLTKAFITIKNKYFIKSNYDDNMIKIKLMNLLKEYFCLDNKTSMLYIDTNRLYLSIEDDKTIFFKLYDLVPLLIEKLLVEQKKFTLDDLYFNISTRLCNGDPNILNQILSNKKNENYLINLIKNYCDLDKNYYIRKSIPNTSENAIDISVLDGYQFEELIQKLLIAKGYVNVTRIGGAGDRGIDIIAKKLNTINNKMETCIFQCKRWVNNVGGEPIQRLHSMITQYNTKIHHAYCITTSDYTEAGIYEAKNTNVILINGISLSIMLNDCFPGKYFNNLLNKE